MKLLNFCRSGPFNGGNGINKLDCNSMSGNANARVMFRSELDKASIARDFMAGLNKERLVPKGNKYVLSLLIKEILVAALKVL